MEKFRKGDRVLISGVISSDHVIDGKMKVEIEPYHDIFVQMADITMKRPHIVVGDTVWCPDNGTRHATVLAIGEDHLWVSFGDGCYATWYAPLVGRIDPEPAGEPAEEAA